MLEIIWLWVRLPISPPTDKILKTTEGKDKDCHAEIYIFQGYVAWFLNDKKRGSSHSKNTWSQSWRNFVDLYLYYMEKGHYDDILIFTSKYISS